MHPVHRGVEVAYDSEGGLHDITPATIPSAPQTDCHATPGLFTTVEVSDNEGAAEPYTYDYNDDYSDSDEGDDFALHCANPEETLPTDANGDDAVPCPDECRESLHSDADGDDFDNGWP